MASILIRGSGVAAACCAHLLHRFGLDISFERVNRPRLPAVMLGEAAQKLLCDVFDRDDFFAGLPRVRRRVVAWGKETETIALPHSSVVVSEWQILDRIEQALKQTANKQSSQTDWTVFASVPSSRLSVEHHVGYRTAVPTPVKFKTPGATETCWIESLDKGWLFLLPSDKGTGWLLSVGESPESLLAQSRLIQDEVEELAASKGTFLCHPRAAVPLAKAGWLACGTAALAFDPLCGDGMGNAIREAILACAVIRAAVDGLDGDALANHYQARLLAGFKRHLELCRDFYKSGGSGAWWKEQVRQLEHGISWSSEQLTGTSISRFRLNGFTLERTR